MNIVDNRPTAQTFKAYLGPDIFSDDDHGSLPSVATLDWAELGSGAGAEAGSSGGGLSARLGDKAFDPVTFVVTKVEPSAFASQLTLLDLPVFQAIRPEVTAPLCLSHRWLSQ